MDFLNSNGMKLLEKGMEYVWQKQQVHTTNIANAETPGYKAKYITFEDELRRNLKGSFSNKQLVENAIDSANIRVKVAKNETFRLDENGVNTDTENIELARAQLQYDYLVKQINNQFTMLKAVIEGR